MKLIQLGATKTKLRPDWWLLVAVLVLTAIGIIMVFSASQYFAAYEPYNDAYKFLKDQLFNAAVGLVILIIAYQVKIKFYKKITYPVFIALLGVLVFMVLSTNIATIGEKSTPMTGGMNRRKRPR